MATTAYLNPAQYLANFAVWDPNTGSAYVAVSGGPTVPKLAQVNPNNLPNFNVLPVQVHQKYTRKTNF